MSTPNPTRGAHPPDESEPVHGDVWVTATTVDTSGPPVAPGVGRAYGAGARAGDVTVGQAAAGDIDPSATAVPSEEPAMVGNADSHPDIRPAPAGLGGQPEGGASSEGKADRLPAARIGLAAGTVGMLCCLGPTCLALLGVVGAGTAYTWAYDLYGGYTWWFRLAGLAVAAGLVWWALRRRQSCSLAGARAARYRIGFMLVVAVATYEAIYWLTTWAGTYAK